MTAPHVPFMPARSDLAEAVFLSRWQELNQQLPKFLSALLGHRASVRDCRIAASFITWLGTSCGNSFLHQAKLQMESQLYAEIAYLAAWALTNRRDRLHSSNVRTIEVILSPKSLFQGSDKTPYQRAKELRLTLDDMDTVESIVKWLASDHGNTFVEDCLAQHQANRDEQARQRNLRLNAMLGQD